MVTQNMADGTGVENTFYTNEELRARVHYVLNHGGPTSTAVEQMWGIASIVFGPVLHYWYATGHYGDNVGRSRTMFRRHLTFLTHYWGTTRHA